MVGELCLHMRHISTTVRVMHKTGCFRKTINESAITNSSVVMVEFIFLGGCGTRVTCFLVQTCGQEPLTSLTFPPGFSLCTSSGFLCWCARTGVFVYFIVCNLCSARLDDRRDISRGCKEWLCQTREGLSSLVPSSLPHARIFKNKQQL